MSQIRSLDALLLIAAVIGGVLTYLASRTCQQLAAEKTRLEQKVGSLPIEDPSKIHVRALETGEPLHFAWRVYLPAGVSSRWQAGGGGGSRSPNSQPQEFLARVRLRESDEGILNVFTKGGPGSSRFGLGDRKLADLLRDRWDEIRVEQLGADHLVVVEPDELAVLLRLTFPEQFKREAEQKLSKRDWKCFQAVLFDYCIGSPMAFQKAETDQPSADQ